MLQDVIGVGKDALQQNRKGYSLKESDFCIGDGCLNQFVLSEKSKMFETEYLTQSFGVKLVDLTCHEIGNVCESLFGMVLPYDQLVRLGGVPDNASVSIEADQTDSNGSQLNLTATHKFFTGEVSTAIFLNENSELVVYYEFLELKKSVSHGFGTHLMWHTLIECYRLGVKKIIVDAARGEKYSGYYAFPRWGFEAHTPSEYEGSEYYHPSLLKVMSTDEGRTWWKKVGTPVKAVFDLSNNSRSWKAFYDYLLVNNFIKFKTDL